MVGSNGRYAFRFERAAATRFVARFARGLAGAVEVPAVASLNSRNESPTALPISGSFPGPKTNSTTARIKISSGKPTFGISLPPRIGLAPLGGEYSEATRLGSAPGRRGERTRAEPLPKPGHHAPRSSRLMRRSSGLLAVTAKGSPSPERYSHSPMLAEHLGPLGRAGGSESRADWGFQMAQH